MANGQNRRSVPDWNELNAISGGEGDAFERAVLDDSDQLPWQNYGPSRRTFRRTNRRLRPDPFRYLDDARNPGLRKSVRDADMGLESDLLPYRPTPTSEPGRPRTLAAGYDHKARQLRIKFRNGSRYVYYDVPPEVWQEFQAAPSPGRFMNAEIVDQYEYEQETHPYLPDPWPRRWR